MPAVFRLLLAGSLLLLAAGSAPAQNLSDADRAAALAAIGAARSGDWTQAYTAAGRSSDPLPMKIVHWLDYTRSNVTGRFADISSFIAQNPDWPSQKILRRQAEQALFGESDDTAAAWFQKFPPMSPLGKARAAAIAIAHGQNDAGLAAMRAAWVEAISTPMRSANSGRATAATSVPRTTRSGSTGCYGIARTRRRATCCPWCPPIFVPRRRLGWR